MERNEQEGREMRIIVNDNSIDGLAAIAACYADPAEIARRLGLTEYFGLVKGGGRNADEYRDNLAACVIVETDDQIRGFGRL
jgi:hypothetical protein